MDMERYETRIKELELELAKTKQELEFYKSRFFNQPSVHLNQLVFNLPNQMQEHFDNTGPGKRY